MVSKSLPVSLIVEEMNWAVKEQSPTERFVAALVVCIDNRNHVIELWNGGIPKALVFDSSGDISYAFKLGDLPLGVLDSTFAAQTEIFQWHEQSQLVIYSDGISEAENENGEPFGDIGLINAIKDAPAGERFEGLRVAVNKHLGVRHALDDMSLLIVDCPFNLRG